MIDSDFGPEGMLLGFVERFGHIQYGQLISGPRPIWLREHLNYSSCEIDRACPVSPRAPLVPDHCHVHGWIRGVVCVAHNVRLGQIDAVRAIDGVVADFSRTPYGAHLDNCPGCSGSAVVTRLEDYAPPTERPLRLVRHPRTYMVHQARTDVRTWCGISADAMEPVDRVIRNMRTCASCGDAWTRGYPLRPRPVPSLLSIYAAQQRLF